MKRLLLCTISAMMLAGCGATGPQFAGLEDPPPDESIIYYLRPKSFGGSAVFYTVKENAEPVCTLKTGGYFPHHTTPGEKFIEATTEVTTRLNINAEKGKRHYVLGDVTWGFIIGQPELYEIDEETAVRYLKKCRLLEAAEK